MVLHKPVVQLFWSCLIVSGMYFGAGLVGTAFSDDPPLPPPPNKLEIDTVNGLKKIENHHQNVASTWGEEIFNPQTRELKRSKTARFVRSGNKLKLERLDETNAVLSLSVASPEISFYVKRKSSADKFTFVKLSPSDEFFVLAQDFINTNKSWAAESSFRVSRSLLPDLFPKLESREWTQELSTEKRKIISMKAVTKPWMARDGEHFNRISIDFDSASKVILKEQFETVNVESSEVVGSVSYSRVYFNLDVEFPKLVRLISKTFDEHGNPSTLSRFRIIESTIGGVNDSEFTLEGNGLAESASDKNPEK